MPGLGTETAADAAGTEVLYLDIGVVLGNLTQL